MAEFGENLKRVREEKGVTQQTLADYLYVTRQAISRWEGGSRYPDLMTAKKMAQYFGISLDELLSDDDMKLYAEKNAIMESSVAKKVQMLIFAVALMSAITADISQGCLYFLTNELHTSDTIMAILAGVIPFLLLAYGTYASICDKLNGKAAGWMVGIYFGSIILMAIVNLIRYEIKGMWQYCSLISDIWSGVGLVLEIAILVFGLRFFLGKKQVLPVYVLLGMRMIYDVLCFINVFLIYHVNKEYHLEIFNEITIFHIFSLIQVLLLNLAFLMMAYTLNKKRKLAARTVTSE